MPVRKKTTKNKSSSTRVKNKVQRIRTVKKSSIKPPKTKVSKKKVVQKKTTSKQKTTRRKTVVKKPVKRKISRRKVAKVIRELKNIPDDLELKIFNDHAAGPVLNVPETSPEEQEPALTQVKAKLESESVNIKVNQPKTSSQVRLGNILDLKGVNNFSKENRESKKLLALEIEKNPKQIFLNFLSGQFETEVGYLKNAYFAHKILNISIIAWSLYLGIFLYKIFYQPVRFLVSAVLFISQGFGQYVQILFNFSRLIASSLAGKVKFDRENFLYPDRALVNLSLFPSTADSDKPARIFVFSPVAVKSLAIFLIIALVIALPVKGLDLLDGLQSEKARVLGASETAYSSLQLALRDIQTFSWVSASEHFAASRGQFENLEKEFSQNHTFIKKLLLFIPLVKDKLSTAENMVNIGVDMSLLGEELTFLLHLLQSSDSAVTLTQKISAIKQSISKIKSIETRINTAFAGVTISALPTDIQAEVELLQNALPQLFASLNQIEELMDFSYQVLGGDKQQKYLLIFQNSDELRPAGGFMGSLSIIDVYQGKIISSETPTGGPYDWQGWVKDKTLAPQPLWIVNSTWQLQDANWYYDFPTSVEKILDFYHQTRPELVDGVIAVNSYVLPQILKLTGAIEMPKYDKVLTPDNVLLEIQKAVELEYDPDANEPKKIIGDLLEIIQEKILDLTPEQFVSLLEIANQSLLNKDIQMYFINKDLQTKVEKWNWAGQAKAVKGDYLAIINANIAGAKTDRFMLQEVTLDSSIQESGEIINTLRIKRTNDGIAGDIFYGHNNVDYLKIYVPLGSELMVAEGSFEPPQEEFFEIPAENISADPLLGRVEKNSYYFSNSSIKVSEEFNKTVFAGWLQTNLGETSEIVLQYKLPLNVARIEADTNSQFINKFDKILNTLGVKVSEGDKIWHSLYWQKQSGQHNNQSNYNLSFPKEWQIDYSAHPGFADKGIIKFQLPLEKDFSTGFLFGTE